MLHKLGGFCVSAIVFLAGFAIGFPGRGETCSPCPAVVGEGLRLRVAEILVDEERFSRAPGDEFVLDNGLGDGSRLPTDAAEALLYDPILDRPVHCTLGRTR